MPHRVTAGEIVVPGAIDHVLEVLEIQPRAAAAQEVRPAEVLRGRSQWRQLDAGKSRDLRSEALQDWVEGLDVLAIIAKLSFERFPGFVQFQGAQEFRATAIGKIKIRIDKNPFPALGVIDLGRGVTIMIPELAQTQQSPGVSLDQAEAPVQGGNILASEARPLLQQA